MEHRNSLLPLCPQQLYGARTPGVPITGSRCPAPILLFYPVVRGVEDLWLARREFSSDAADNPIVQQSFMGAFERPDQDAFIAEQA
jgi:hypothetical protein